jgi:hypothetical protein
MTVSGDGLGLPNRMRERTGAHVRGPIIVAIALILLCSPCGARAQAAITFVQGNYAVPQSPQVSVSVPFLGAQTGGNLNVVIVGWNDATASITAVTDTKGNAYTLAVGPTVRAGNASQAIYYAKNIGGTATNTVTVRFTVAAVYADIRVLEYSGLDPVVPLHASVGASGASATSSSGALTTSVANVLLVAGNVVATTTSGPGAGFTSRMITNPDGDIAQDRIVSTAGTYSATAPLTSSGYWVMQLVAFKAPTGPPPPDTTPPTVSITVPTAGPTYTANTSPLTIGGSAADSVGVTQVSWASDRGGSGTAAGTTTWSAAGIALQAGANVVTVTARDAAGNMGTATLTVTYDPTAPTVSITAPTAGAAYTTNISPLTLGGTAGDNIGVTQVSWASDRGGSGTAAGTMSWSAAGIALQPGVNVLTVTARDAAGNTGTAILTVTYTAPDTVSPTVSITAPTAGPTYATNISPLTLGGTAGDNVGVTQVSWSSNRGGSGTALGTTSWSAPGIALQPGANALTVTARDAAGNTGTATLTVTYDLIAPTVSITAPAAGATVSGTTTITATALDNIGVVGVQFLLDAAALGVEVTSAPYSVPWNTVGVSNGSHSLAAVARDGAGNTAISAAVAVSVSNTAAAISFVQGNYAVPQSPQVTVPVAFLAAQTAGNLNVVVVGWSDTAATITSVSDSAGNAYALAVGPTVSAGQETLGTYFAPNIRASAANTVTVRFSAAAAAYPDVRILEYSGLDLVNPLHATAAAAGSSITSSSGSLTTTVPNTLLVAANVVATTTVGPSTGFTTRMITNPDGNIAEDRIVSSTGTYSASTPLSATGSWVMQLVAFQAVISIPPPPDTTPPTVSITVPAANATVAGSVTVAAAAADDTGVVGVQFLIDGAPLGFEVGFPPYSVSWDTTTVATGSHVLTARARDAAGYATTSDGVGVMVTRATSADIGQWSGAINWPLVAIHASLLSTGQVLVWDYETSGQGVQLWNPATGTFTAAPYNTEDLFCSGLASLPDGRILVAGGHIENFVGITDATIFNPTTRSWATTGRMSFARWYPTLTALPDGRMLVTSGAINCETCTADTPEVYDPVTGTWTSLLNATLTLPLYPHMFVLPDGKVLVTGAYESYQEPVIARVLHINSQTWTTVDPAAVNGGSAAMYLPGKIVTSGMGTSGGSDVTNIPATPTTYVLDMTQPVPAWRQTASMAFPRDYHNLTNLPDGSVLATGGGQTTGATDPATAVFEAELWAPATETWTTLAAMHVPRRYHSTALLLPDGRVLVAGGGRNAGVGAPTNANDHLNAEIFSPPYLFKGPRPVITGAPATIQYAADLFVATPDATAIATVSLLRPGSVTHAFNQDQRFIPLTFQQAAAGLNVQAPANANLAPPGYYLLFIVDTNGVPSVAPFVKLQ